MVGADSANWNDTLDSAGIDWKQGVNSADLGATDPDTGGGKCVMINNPDAKHNDWYAILMFVDYCPDCDQDKPHHQIDMAIPGMDSAQSWSQNCASPCTSKFNMYCPGTKKRKNKTGDYGSFAPIKYSSITCDQAAMQGVYDWADIDCTTIGGNGAKDAKRLQEGCEIFKEWYGDEGGQKWNGLKNVKFVPVPCPKKFVDYLEESRKSNSAEKQKAARVSGVFSLDGTTDVLGNIPYSWDPSPGPSPSPAPSPAPSPGPVPTPCSDCSNGGYTPTPTLLPTFSSYVQSNIWNSINKYNSNGVCNPLAWRNSLSFNNDETPKDFTTINQFYDPQYDKNKKGMYNSQRTTIANSWHIFNNNIPIKFVPDISIDKVSQFIINLFCINDNNFPLFNTYYENSDEYDYQVFNILKFWNKEIHSKYNELISKGAVKLIDNQILITYPHGTCTFNDTIYLPANISITGQGKENDNTKNTIIHVKNDDDSVNATHIRFLDGNNAISNIRVEFNNSADPNINEGYWVQFDGKEVGTNGPGTFTLGGWCKTSYASGGDIGCRLFKDSDDSKSCTNGNGSCWDSTVETSSSVKWTDNKYLPPESQTRFLHGTTNIVLDNIYAEKSTMFFYCRQSPMNTPHTFIKINNCHSMNTKHDGINLHAGINHVYVSDTIVEWSTVGDQVFRGDDAFANASSIGILKSHSYTGKYWTKSKYILDDPVVTDYGTGQNSICRDTRHTIQIDGTYKDNEHYYKTHPYEMLAVGWNINWKNIIANNVLTSPYNSNNVKSYGGAQISARNFKGKGGNAKEYGGVVSAYCGGTLKNSVHGIPPTIEFGGECDNGDNCYYSWPS